MPKYLKISTILVAVIAFISGYFYFQVDWEARAIRQQFEALTKVVEKDGPVTTFEALSRSRRLSEFFTDPASVEYFRGRKLPEDLDSISAGFLSTWGKIETASVTVLRHEIEIRGNGTDARSRATLRGRVIADGRDRMSDTLDYRIGWQNVDGEWLIQTIHPLD